MPTYDTTDTNVEAVPQSANSWAQFLKCLS